MHADEANGKWRHKMGSVIMMSYSEEDKVRMNSFKNISKTFPKLNYQISKTLSTFSFAV